MGCDGVLRFFLRCISFGCISVVCGAGHLERVFGAVGRGHTMGFEGKCRLREVSSFWVRRVWNWAFLFFAWFSVGCDNVLRFLFRGFIFVFIPSVCGVDHFEMVVGEVG